MKVGSLSMAVRIGFICAFMGAGAMAAYAVVTVNPGESIAEAFNNNGENTTFLIKAGLHRVQWFELPRPKIGCVVEGETDGNGKPLTIITGARTLENWTREGNFWVHGDVQDRLGSNGGEECADETTVACRTKQDLFFDDNFMRQVVSLDKLTEENDWYFDAAGQKACIARDPAGHTVEMSVAEYAILGNHEGTNYNFTVRNLIIEKFANQINEGAVRFNSGCAAENCEVRLCHGSGISVGSSCIVRNCHVHHTGQAGVYGQWNASGVLVENNELAYNSLPEIGFVTHRNAGVMMFLPTNCTIISNHVHHNNYGIFFNDGGSGNLVEGNVVEYNEAAGIRFRLHIGSIIKCNIVRYNTAENIEITKARGAEVYNNLVRIADKGCGIMVCHAIDGEYTRDHNIHHNIIVHENPFTGVNGMHSQSLQTDSRFPGGAGLDYYATCNIRFDYNTYYVHDPSVDYWMWGGLIWQGWMNWDEFRAAGHEANGSISTDIGAAPATPSGDCSDITSAMASVRSGGVRPADSPDNVRPFRIVTRSSAGERPAIVGIDASGPHAIEVYALAGERICTVRGTGARSYAFGAPMLQPGVYFLRADASGRRWMGKINVR